MEKRLFKVKGQITIDIEWETYASSEDDALSKFYAADAREIIDDGKILDVNTDNEEAELVEPIFVIKTKHIDYYVSWEDVESNYDVPTDLDDDDLDEWYELKVDEIKSSLPQELTLEIECERDDLDDYVVDAISDETGWLIDSCDYEIIEEK